MRSVTPVMSVPRGGWVRTLREALGMSAVELGERLGIGANAVSKMEANESEGRIRLATLARSAEALDCDIVYALVPRRRLDEMVDRQAAASLGVTMVEVGHSMGLEAQGVSQSVTAEQFSEQLREVRDQPGLWADVY